MGALKETLTLTLHIHDQREQEAQPTAFCALCSRASRTTCSLCNASWGVCTGRHVPACNACFRWSGNKKSRFTWRAPFIKPHPDNCHWAITPRCLLVTFLLGYYGYQIPGECLPLNLERNDILLEIWEGKCFLPNGALYFCLPSCLYKRGPFQLKQPVSTLVRIPSALIPQANTSLPGDFGWLNETAWTCQCWHFSTTRQD